MCPPACSPEQIAAMRQRRREGATIQDLIAEFDRSRPTVCKHTKGLRPYDGTPCDLGRHRRIVAAVDAGALDTEGLARRFGHKHANSFCCAAWRARRRLARAAQEARP